MPTPPTPADAALAPRSSELATGQGATTHGATTREPGGTARLWRTGEVEAARRALPDLVLRLDADGVVREARAGGAAMPGALGTELVGRPLRAALPDDAALRLELALAAARRSGRPSYVAWAVDDAEGVREVEARVVPLGGGEVVLLVCEALERAATALALRAGEELVRRLTENATDMVQVIGADGRIVYTGPSILHLLGYPAEAIAGTPATDYVHPDDVALVHSAIAAILGNPGVPLRVEYRVRHGDGSYRHFEGNCRTLSPTSPEEGIVVNARDITDRKRAEDLLRESEERWRTVIANTHDIISVLDVAGRVTFQSPSFERVLGYPADEMLGRSALELLHPDDEPAVLAALAAIVERPGSTGHAEYRYQHRDGSWRVLETYGRTLLPDSPEAGLVFNSRDVTERREAADRVRRSEEHFRALIERSYDLVQLLDAEGRITYTGPSVQRLLGYTPEEIVGGTVPDFIHPEDVGAAGALVARILANPGTSDSLVYRVRHKDGTWRWLEVWARTISPTSAEQGLVANARDITERREAERALAESEARYRGLIEAAQDMITVIDAEGTVRFQSPSAERVLGFRPEEMVGRNIMEFLHPEDVPMAIGRLGAVVRHPGTIECVRYRARHKDGSWRHLESTGRTVLPDTAAAGAVGIVRDITAQVEAEAALRQAKAEADGAREEAERANLAKSEFLSRMSHELRTPLNSILGFAQLLDGAELAPRLQKGVQHILTAGEHLLNLINEVLDIARIESGRQQLSIEPVRLATVMQEAVALVRPLAAARGVWVSEPVTRPSPLAGGDAAGDGPREEVVDASAAAADAWVRADRQRLAQVLLNLLSNAVKYNRPGGRVRLACEQAPADTLVVRVEDSGPGIAADRVDELFVPFARLGAERTEVEGTGLGLALSRRLVEAMGGRLALERTSAAGSVFRVELARADDPLHDAAGQLDAEGRAPAAPHAGATLLYVEDNLANLTLVEQILESRPGWRLVPALQGRLGVELAREHLPDVILLDLHLPDVPGEEVLRHLRADPRTAHTPVVIISADATPRTVERLRAAGADAYLTKPLRVQQFLAVVGEALARVRGAGAPAGR